MGGFSLREAVSVALQVLCDGGSSLQAWESWHLESPRILHQCRGCMGWGGSGGKGGLPGGSGTNLMESL